VAARGDSVIRRCRLYVRITPESSRMPDIRSCESDIYNSIRESEVRGALEKYVGGDAGICNSNFCGRDLFGLVGFIRHDGVSHYWNNTKNAGYPA
jgi:hypothetical protein